jgi:hypothetical protein
MKMSNPIRIRKKKCWIDKSLGLVATCGINDELKNISQIEHTRHRAMHNFVMNLISALVAYCFLDKKPAIKFDVEPQHGQLTTFQAE